MVEYAQQNDLSDIQVFDDLSPQMLIKSIDDGRVLVFKVENLLMGIARWNYFWDRVPFLNKLYVPSGYTHSGIGTALLKSWENEMQLLGYPRVFASTMANERGQHFLRKYGYQDIGNLFDYDEGGGLELILEKRF
jgi:N-acetylglutamate synthase-like GNAT family acetyltransferase